MKVLVTGAAGFIGYHLTERLSARGDSIVGLDVINDYYDVRVKHGRLERLGLDPRRVESAPGELVIGSNPQVEFIKLDLGDKEGLDRLFASQRFDAVVNLAAQAGVRYSLTHPEAYVNSNVVGFLNVLEACRFHPVKHLVYASSSSVYGSNTKIPFSTDDNVDHPVSLYAASKKANELMAHTYSHLFGVPTTGLRFFTVYGPWGRPDMALFLFTKAILEDRPIDVYNYGEMRRDFTYIDDIVEGVVRVLDHQPESTPPYKVYNIGNSAPVKLMDFIEEIERQLGKTAQKNLLPLQPGDVPASHADVTDLMADLGYKPETSVRQGIAAFVKWYREFYRG